VRIADMALLYILLAIGLNIVVGYAGLLDLGYVAFFAVGAYMYGLLSSPHLVNTFAWIAAAFPEGMHMPIWLIVPVGAALAGIFGMLLGAPTLKLRGDYLAIVTLGFGEIIRVFMNNLDHPVNITNGPKGLDQIDPISIFGLNLGKKLMIGDFEIASVSLYYYLFLSLVLVTIVVSHRLEVSRIGRAWMAIREDEIAAKAMGLNTRNLKLLAFGMGATFGGVSGAMFAGFQGFISPESFSLMESGDDCCHGGTGWLGLFARCDFGRHFVVGFARSAALCRWTPARDDGWPFGRLHHAPITRGFGHDRDHVDASPWTVAFP
jgi:branched-chain amino acid transport system permease protein